MSCRYTRISYCLLAGLGAVLLSCSGNQHGRPDDVPEASGASVRFINLSPDSPALAIYLNREGTRVATLAFGEGCPYLSIEAGLLSVRAYPDGMGGIPEDRTYPLDVTVDAYPGFMGTVVIYGPFETLEALTLDEPTDEQDANMVPFPPPRIGVAHVALDLGPVDVYMYTDLVRSWMDTDEDRLELVYADLEYAATTGFFPRYTTSLLALDEDGDGQVDLRFDLSSSRVTDVTTLLLVTDTPGSPLVVAFNADSVTTIAGAFE
ncbi:MAG: DUF4397 domain-containing protein [Planctomycetota bacterium]